MADADRTDLLGTVAARGETARARRRDIKRADRLFIAALMNTPRDVRPHGIVTWAAEVFRTSRQTLYDIGDRVGNAVSGLPMVEKPKRSRGQKRGRRWRVRLRRIGTRDWP